MAKVKVVCDTMVGVQTLMEEFQKAKLDDIDRVRAKEFRILMKNGDVIQIFNGSDKMSTLGLTDAITEEEFRTAYGLEFDDRLSGILNSVNRQYKNMSEISDW